MQRLRQVFNKVFMMALFGLIFVNPLSAETLAQKYPKILVLTDGEDATSTFQYIYLLDKKETLARVIVGWNGGCCNKARADEFSVSGKSYKFETNYHLADKPKDMVKTVLCGSAKKVRPKIPGASFDISGLSDVIEVINDAKPFKGCD